MAAAGCAGLGVLVELVGTRSLGMWVDLSCAVLDLSTSLAFLNLGWELETLYISLCYYPF